MCGIAGIVTAEEAPLGDPLQRMLKTMEHRGPDGAGYVMGNVFGHARSLGELDINGESSDVALGHLRLAITGEPSGIQPFMTHDHQISLLHNGEIYNHQNLQSEFHADVRVATGSDSEVLLHMTEQEYKGDLAEAVDSVLGKVDGVYALAVSDGKQTVVARDKLGVRPLYYTADNDLVAFSSERRALEEIGCHPVDSLRVPPGHMMVMQDGQREMRPFWAGESLRDKPRLANMKDAVAAYGAALEDAIRKRVHDRDHVGIIFSGGIDSFLVAYLVDQLGIPFTCYAAGREGSPDTNWSRRLCESFGWDLNVSTLSPQVMECEIPEVIGVIEDQGLIQVEVAMPIYAAVRAASRAGERVLLTGQGADELCGGYSWYPTIVDREGYGEFVKRSLEDTMLLYSECLEREDKIAMAHSVELRVPFLDEEVVRTAFDIAPELKIRKGGDDMGKRFHREYALSVGVPYEIAYRVKEAAQHGARVHDAIEKFATDAGFTIEGLKAAGYDPAKTVREQLGSCSRYGYKYGQQDMWRAGLHVQYYLDSRTVGLGLLPPPALEHWRNVRRRLPATRSQHVDAAPSC